MLPEVGVDGDAFFSGVDTFVFESDLANEDRFVELFDLGVVDGEAII